MKNKIATSRRQFVKYAGLYGFLSNFNLPAYESFANDFHHGPAGIILHQDEGEHYVLRKGSVVSIKLSKNKNGIDSLSFCREDIIPGDEIPIHKHLKEDELIYIQSGEGLFTMGEEKTEMKRGSMAFIPKNTWHGLQNTGAENIRMIFSYRPSGFEGFFREVGYVKGDQPKKFTEKKFLEISKKYNVAYKDIASRVRQQ